MEEKKGLFKMNKYATFFGAIVLIGAIAVFIGSRPSKTSMVEQNGENKDYRIKVSSVHLSEGGDTMYADFKIMKSDKKRFSYSLLKGAKEKFVVSETGMSDKYCPQVEDIVDIRNSEHKSMSDNLSIMMLIDRSKTIPDSVLWNQKRTLESFVKALPETKIYVSFMNDGTVERTMYCDSSNVNIWEIEFFGGSAREHRGEKQLYRSILSKLQELSGEEQTESTYPGTGNADLFSDNEGEKMLFVFTDGMVKNESGVYYGGMDNFYRCKCEYEERVDKILKGELKNIPVHCVYMGDGCSDEEMLSELMALCSTGKEEEEKGHFYSNIAPDSLQSIMMGTLDSLSSDYRLVMINPKGKTYSGSEVLLNIKIIEGGEMSGASGQKNYSAGSPDSPIVVGESGGGTRLLKGLLLGLGFIVLVYLILQYVEPKIRLEIFRKKYVKPYVKAENVNEERCFICKVPIKENERVVTRCNHYMHEECWPDTNHTCPQCKKGTYYNKKKLSDSRNAIHYMQWIVYGLGAGLLTWLFSTMLQPLGLFDNMISSMTNGLYPFENADEETMESVRKLMSVKMSGLLLSGTVMGFFIVLAFGWVLEFKKKDARTVRILLLRAMVGAIGGFVAFLLGDVIIILLGKEFSNMWIDWIPWLFFSLIMAVILWYKTEINLITALYGGAISVLFSFVVLYMLTSPITSMFSYMIYSAGLGCSIAVVHAVSGKFVLRISGDSIKERDIAISKWMTATGGFRKVSIGKSNGCVICMNWDESNGIKDRMVELYMEKGERPACKVLEEGVSRQGRSVSKGQSFTLVDGMDFSIGKTTFTYIES